MINSSFDIKLWTFRLISSFFHFLSSPLKLFFLITDFSVTPKLIKFVEQNLTKIPFHFRISPCWWVLDPQSAFLVIYDWRFARLFRPEILFQCKSNENLNENEPQTCTSLENQRMFGEFGWEIQWKCEERIELHKSETAIQAFAFFFLLFEERKPREAFSILKNFFQLFNDICCLLCLKRLPSCGTRL